MTIALCRLSAASLESLAAAFEQGRLSSGSELALRSFIPASECEEVGEEISRLLSAGVTGQHLSYTLRSILAERGSHNRGASAVELVWTGPEGSGDNTRETSVVIRELFSSAKRSVLVAGFAVYQGRSVFKVLAERMDADPALEVTMFLNVARTYKDTTLEHLLVRRFANDFKSQQWPGSRLPKVFYDPRALSLTDKKRASLHAKCVVVDDEKVFITSANFTEAAQERNIEMGVVFTSKELASRSAAQFRRLVTTGAALQIAF